MRNEELTAAYSRIYRYFASSAKQNGFKSYDINRDYNS